MKRIISALAVTVFILGASAQASAWLGDIQFDASNVYIPPTCEERAADLEDEVDELTGQVEELECKIDCYQNLENPSWTLLFCLQNCSGIEHEHVERLSRFGA